ncbi:metallophosphoesterase [Escherichia coli]
MATYLIGDVHGCYDELIALLHKVEFTPGNNTLWLTGDLVARGPGSLDVLRYVKSLGDSVRLVLGNDDCICWRYLPGSAAINRKIA